MTSNPENRTALRAEENRPAPPSQQVNASPPKLLDDWAPAAWHHCEQYANNRIEADQGQLKRRLDPMRACTPIAPRSSLSPTTPFVQTLRRGHYGLTADIPAVLRFAVAFGRVWAWFGRP